MPTINYHNRVFRSVSNTPNGEVDETTLFHFQQEGEVVWATYRGGSIVMGTLVAKVDTEGCLDMRYQHLNTHGEFMTGKCRSTPEILPNGRICLHEVWQWTSGDMSRGESIIEEVS